MPTATRNAKNEPPTAMPAITPVESPAADAEAPLAAPPLPCETEGVADGVVVAAAPRFREVDAEADSAARVPDTVGVLLAVAPIDSDADGVGVGVEDSLNVVDDEPDAAVDGLDDGVTRAAAPAKMTRASFV